MSEPHEADASTTVTEDSTAGAAPADRVRISYPADLSDWGRSQVETSRFRTYLRRVHDRAAVGDTWPEFVGVGCCGGSLDVPLQVEAVDGGTRLTEETDIEFAVRQACNIGGGWEVQSEAGADGDDPEHA